MARRSPIASLLAPAAVVAALFLGAPLAAQDSVPVSFPAGQSGTTINGTIRGDEYIDYVLSARKGQTLVAHLTVTGTNGNGSAMFNILPAGADYPALYNGSTDDDARARVVLPETGDWAIRVYLMGNDRDRGRTVGFSIDVRIPPGQAGATGTAATGEVATVTGLRGGDLLNVRSGAGATHKVIGQLAEGDRVTRLGCRRNGGTEWCEIEMRTDMRGRGWVAARYLASPGADRREPPTTERRVRFAAGTTGASYTHRLAPGASRRYVLGAQAGQELSVRFPDSGQPVSYQVFNPDGTFLLDMTSTRRAWRGELWQSGDHVIEVINRRNQDHTYTVTFGIE